MAAAVVLGGDVIVGCTPVSAGRETDCLPGGIGLPCVLILGRPVFCGSEIAELLI